MKKYFEIYHLLHLLFMNLRTGISFARLRLVLYSSKISQEMISTVPLVIPR